MATRPVLLAVPQRGKWLSAGGIVVDARGRVALVRQWDRSGRLRWTLPKGKVDPGETVEEAALREVLEEAGLRATIVRHLGVFEGKRSYVHLFEMALVRDHKRHDDETVEVCFVKKWKALELVTTDRDRRALEGVMRPVRAEGKRAATG
jgi:8-oxo-dGTP pyrophosphatase MutT (NUDIX family)